MSTRNSSRLLRFIFSVSPLATSGGIAALTTWAVKVGWLDQIPAPNQTVFQLGLLVDSLLPSIVASYIFFVVLIQLHDFSEREAIRPYVDKHVGRIVSAAKSQIEELNRHSTGTLNFEASPHSDIVRIVGTVRLSDRPNMVDHTGNRVDWIEYFRQNRSRSAKSASKILTQVRFLDGTLVSRVVSVDDCSFFSAIDQFPRMQFTNQNLEFLAKVFADYIIEVRLLAKELQGTDLDGSA